MALYPPLHTLLIRSRFYYHIALSKKMIVETGISFLYAAFLFLLQPSSLFLESKTRRREREREREKREEETSIYPSTRATSHTRWLHKKSANIKMFLAQLRIETYTHIYFDKIKTYARIHIYVNLIRLRFK